MLLVLELFGSSFLGLIPFCGLEGSSFVGHSVVFVTARTKNYSGAELEGVVRSVVSYALNRQISFDDLTKPLDEESIKVTMDDFLNALHEIGPTFGASMDDLERRSIIFNVQMAFRLNGIIDCGERHKHIQERALLLVEKIKDNQSPLVTYLLEGPTGSGKTSMTATIGIESDFLYVKIVSCDIIDERKIITSMRQQGDLQYFRPALCVVCKPNVKDAAAILYLNVTNQSSG
ncbi:hypothetical protein ZIOFF_013078 [Zingiber officinale]|uniref:Vesicle-fusing ATPase n=1 Tax=Zingiber officinale TaxID=94328 RepID=A0A8J5HJN0_ZINOF|nr:hypothetical protein ZIOFF_013078 [Zingiber officinale]